VSADDWPDRAPEGEIEDPASRMDTFRGWLYGAGDLHRIPPANPLVDGWLDQDSLAWIIGKSGHGKSFTALDLGGCVSIGADWHGIPTKQAAVLYVVLEGAPGLHSRVQAWEGFYAREMAVNFLVPPRGFHIVADAAPLAMLAREIHAGLIIIDTQNRAAIGLDENSNVDMGHMIASLERVREDTHACVAMVHHTAIEGHRPRGHGSIDGAASTVIRVARDGSLVKIESGKQKDRAKATSLVLCATAHEGGLVLAEQGVDAAVAESERTVLAAIRTLLGAKDNVTHTDIKQYVTSQGTPVATFSWALKRLAGRGLVIRKGNSYTLSEPVQGHL